MSDVLSQAEVENLLSAMDRGGGGGGGAKTGTGPSGAGSGGPKSRDKITPYDFKRPERVGKE